MAKKPTSEENGIMNPKPRRISLWAWLRGRFLAGMVIAAPIAITFYVLQFLINFIDNRVKPLLPPALQPETYTNYAVIANNQQTSYDRVVLIEYPKRGSWCIGFVSTGARGEIRSRLGEGHIGVFVPTTPNPTSGFLMYVKEEECIDMDMSIEEGAKMILSAGLVVPDYFGPEHQDQPSLPLPGERAEKVAKKA